MLPIIFYLLKVSLSLLVLFIPYWALFRSTTFFKANRFYLLSLLIVPFIIPFVAQQLSFGFEYLDADYAMSTEYSRAATQADTHAAGPPAADSFNMYLLLFYIYLSGIIIFGIRFMTSLYRMAVLHSKSTAVQHNDLNLRILDEIHTPFAFGRTAYFPKPLLDDKRLDFIIRHERTHIQQLHSIDNLVAELVSIVLWFNPLIYVLKKAIRLNHEFLADRAVISSGRNIKEYINLLSGIMLKNNSLQLSHTLIDNSLKRRTLMMKQAPNKSRRLFIFLLMLPLTASLLFAFAKPMTDNIPSRLPFAENHVIKITSEFGNNQINPFTKKLRVHTGVDLHAKKGTPVYATADGKAIHVAEKGAWGKLIILKHGETYETRFAHLNGFAIEEGDIVKKGQLIGYVGSSGLSTGPHLHYEVLKNGENVDPMDYTISTKHTD